MINVDNISYSYSAGRDVLKNVSFKINGGDIVSILGPNGCGKSTLMKIMMGLIKPKSGKVEIDGRSVHAMNRAEAARVLCYVPQNHISVFPYLVRDVVLMGTSAGKMWSSYGKHDFLQAEESLEALKISHLADRAYSALSGGERQLVLVARAIAQKSKIFFIDEPVSGLDYGNQYRLMDQILELSKNKLTFIITTHHPDHVFYLSGRAVLMKNGSVLKCGSVEEAVTSESLYELYGRYIKKCGLAS